MLGQVMVNAIYCVGQILATVFALVSLFTNQWLRGLAADDGDDKYFERVDALDTEYFISTGQDDKYDSVGLFRLWATEDLSYPLPIVDTELKMCKAGLTVAAMLGSVCLYTASFQVFKLFQGNMALEMLLGWATVFQAIMTLAGVATGMSYFAGTFVSDSFGISLFAGWISFMLQLMLIVCSVFKVLLAHKVAKERKEKLRAEQEQSSMTLQSTAKQPVYEKPSLTLRSATSESRLYQPAPATNSRPGTGERSQNPHYMREGSRPGTMQSQQGVRYDGGPTGNGTGDYPMRRAPSQDSKQFDYARQQSPPSRGGGGGRDYMYYDQGDLPRHIR